MERQDIEVFLALAEELHFARTAERLHVSAATVSQTITKLERRFGAPLFRRTTRRVELTPLGRQFLDDLRPAYAQVQAAIAIATAAGQGITGRLELGYMSAAVAQIVLPLADAFRDRMPGCQVAIRETALADLFGPLRRAEVDLSVLPLPADEPDLTVGPVLLSEPAMLAVPREHPLACRPHVSHDDLAGETVFFADDLPGYWIDHHLPVRDRTILTVPGFQEILAYVTSGHGVAIVGTQTERLYPRPGLTCVPIAGGTRFDYALLWRTDRLNAVADAFLSHVTN
ncbi:LysR family transcriptional regulator [Streptosporangium sp. CA-115845]|uniref:LysR family transcriptional regulator n=1 Tax=Streptosporangium sp. CA-115845 TaxID=3240071 RepID=UPI003D92F3E3